MRCIARLRSTGRPDGGTETVAGPVDLSEAHLALDRLRPQLCHCGLKGECLGCKGIEMVRRQLEAVAAAASQPVLLQGSAPTPPAQRKVLPACRGGGLPQAGRRGFTVRPPP